MSLICLVYLVAFAGQNFISHICTYVYAFYLVFLCVCLMPFCARDGSVLLQHAACMACLPPCVALAPPALAFPTPLIVYLLALCPLLPYALPHNPTLPATFPLYTHVTCLPPPLATAPTSAFPSRPYLPPTFIKHCYTLHCNTCITFTPFFVWDLLYALLQQLYLLWPSFYFTPSLCSVSYLLTLLTVQFVLLSSHVYYPIAHSPNLILVLLSHFLVLGPGSFNLCCVFFFLWFMPAPHILPYPIFILYVLFYPAPCLPPTHMTFCLPPPCPLCYAFGLLYWTWVVVVCVACFLYCTSFQHTSPAPTHLGCTTFWTTTFLPTTILLFLCCLPLLPYYYIWIVVLHTFHPSPCILFLCLPFPNLLGSVCVPTATVYLPRTYLLVPFVCHNMPLPLTPAFFTCAQPLITLLSIPGLYIYMELKKEEKGEKWRNREAGGRQGGRAWGMALFHGTDDMSLSLSLSHISSLLSYKSSLPDLNHLLPFGCLCVSHCCA